MRNPILALALATAAGLPAQHDPIRPTHARVVVEVVDGLATVELTLGLRNDGDRIGEADWILPLPDDAVADRFVTRIGDAPPLEGEVLDATRARGVYEAIVRRRRDPGLLEFAGRGCLRARLFPIPAQGQAEVKVRWRQVLPDLNRLTRWSLPLAAAGVDGRAPEQVSFAVEVRSRSPIRTALSPTPGADVRITDEGRVVASFENRPGEPLPNELALYYGLADEAFGLHLLAQRQDAAQDGHFALLISPKRDFDDREIPPRAVTFVVDVSGSMKGQKIAQARGALRQFLQGLRPVDRFDVVPFSTEATPFFGRPVPASAENVAAALERVARLEASGGTNLEQALVRGLPEVTGDDGAVPMCVLLSDGLPTVGQTDVGRLRAQASELITMRSARVFVLGVGHDLHTVLLDDLAEVGRGVRQYVRPDEDIEEKASDLLTKIAEPVMTDLALSIDGAGVGRTTPARLPDLFAGGRLVVTGRYATPGRHTVRLRGRVGEVEREYLFEATFLATESAHEFVPKLWATRRVATLLDEIRRNGAHDELLDEVRALGVEFQIVTPYTAHLVVEDALGVGGPLEVPPPGGGGGRHGGPGPSGPVQPGPSGPSTPGPAGPATGGPAPRGGPYRGPADTLPSGSAGVAAIAAGLRDAGVLPRDATPDQLEALALQVAREMNRAAADLSGLGAGASGARAVDDSVLLARLSGATLATGSDQFFMGGGRVASAQEAILARFVRKVADKVFQLREGVWTDRALAADRAYPKVTRVVAFSDEYFAMLRARPELGRYVALSERMRIVLGDEVFEITAPPAPTGKDG
jgi:Ca-activated chloride channel family protein